MTLSNAGNAKLPTPVADGESILRPEVGLWTGASPPAQHVNQSFCRLVRQSGITLPAERITGACLFAGVSLAILTWLLTGDLLLTASCLPLCLGALLGVLMVARWNRHRRMQPQVLGLAEAVARHLASGRNLTDAMHAAKDSVTDPLRQHLAGYLASLPVHHRHRPLSDTEFTEGMPELILLGTLVEQRADQGTPLSLTLREYAAHLRRQQRLHRKLAAATTAGRLAVGVMMCLPVVVIGFYSWQQPDYLQRLWDSELGRLSALTAVGLQLLGMASATVLLRRVDSAAGKRGRA